jgi:peptide/nickel transport system ATP-binding protein
MVFQNPFDTLNPSMTVGRQIIRALEIFKVGKNDSERNTRMLELLDLVKLPRAFADRMPRQLSGGQKQRVGIARAFAGDARIVVADEPVSALDVSVQAAVTDLLMEIQREHKTTLLFISHDLSIVRYLSDRVMVMYRGWKSKVPGGLCDKEVPPVRMVADGHQVKCHLSDAELANMEPVIKIAAE